MYSVPSEDSENEAGYVRLTDKRSGAPHRVSYLPARWRFGSCEACEEWLIAVARPAPPGPRAPRPGGVAFCGSVRVPT